MKNHKFATLLRRSYRVLNLVMVLAMMLAPTMRVDAYTTTDKPEYTPGSVVTISGDNSDLDTEHNFAAGEPVIVDVVGPNGYTAQCPANADDFGAWACGITLWEGEIAYGEYSYTATGQISGNVEYGTFLDGPPSIDNLWQWATGTPAYASNMGWQHGNINEQNSTYFEGEVIPYYTTFSNMIPGNEYKIRIEWDTTKAGLHALDYITTYDTSYVPTPPCDDAGITCTSTDTIEIPEDTFMTGQWLPGATQIPGVFTAWNADLLLTSGYTNPVNYLGDTSTSIWVTFTAQAERVVLAWGGHIGARIDWGMQNSAVFISGSPYHMRILEFWNVWPTDTKLNVGNTDRSLSASAVIFPAHVIVIKVADPEGNTLFPFTGGLGNFDLIDDGTLTDRTTIDVDVFGDYDITESVPTYWQLDNIVCTDSSGTPIIDLAASTATVNILEADEITCTFFDSLQAGDITIIKQTDPDGSIQVFDFTASYDADGFSLSDGQSNFSGPLVPGTYNVAEIVPAGWELSNATCDDGSDPASIGLGAAEHVTCTFTNQRLGLDLTVTKTADASKDRMYKWLIDKSVDDTLIEIAGGMATFNYDVTVTPDGYVDSGYVLGGTITIDNPNDWQAITLSGITDTLDQGGTCSITEPGPHVVPSDGQLVLHYTCTTDGLTTKNTVNVTWNKDTYHTPTGLATDDAAVSFGLDVETNKIITVIDDKTVPASPVTLGTWDWSDGPHTFEYALQLPGVAGDCVDYTNTAVIDETDQFDTQKVTVCQGVDLTVTKTATASKDRLYKWLIDKSVDDTLIEIAGGMATFNYDVTVTPNGYTDSGYVLGGTITIVNPNNWQDVTVSVADVLDAGGTCAITEAPPYVVPMSDSLVLHYTCTTDGLTTKNTVNVTWNKDTYHTPTGMATDDAAVSFGLDVETNKVITVIDDKTVPASPVTLGTWDWSDGPHTFEYALQLPGVAGDCVDYTNTAVIDETDQFDTQKVTVCQGVDLTVTKTADASKDRLYKWLIDKSVDDTLIEIAGGMATFNYDVTVTPNGYTDSGYVLGGTITIVNPNNWQDVTVSVADVLDAGGTCAITEAPPYVVPMSDSLVLHYTCTTDGLTTKNTVNVTWNKDTYHTPTGMATDDAAVSFGLDVETNKVITVIDDKTVPASPVTLGTWDWSDGPHAFEYALQLPGVAGDCVDYTNTAVIDETDQFDTQKVTVCQGVDLTVTKTAAGTLERTYKWLIDKSVDKTTVDMMFGSVATFNYSVKVTPDGYVDNGWVLGGTITIVNPNNWEDFTVSVADTLDMGGTCTITEVAPYIVPKSGSLLLHYTCVTTGTATKNTATVTWDKTLYATPTGSALGDAAVTFAVVKETNKVITVIDDKTNPALPVTLGTSDFFVGPFEFKYSLEKPGIGGGCVDYTNTAMIKETAQEDKQTVTVCTRYWAFTPGFWKNHFDPNNGHDAWVYTNYASNPLLGSVFNLGDFGSQTPKGLTKTYAELTLLDALSLKGGTNTKGALEILLRAGTAALLNASFHEKMHGTVVGYFPKTSAEIIAMVNAAILSHDRDTMIALAGQLDYWNNGYHLIDWSWDPNVLIP